MTHSIENHLLAAFQNVGFPIDKIEPDIILGSILYDSLTLITFIIELELLLDIEIPAESFNVKWLNKTLKEIIDIIQKLT